MGKRKKPEAPRFVMVYSELLQDETWKKLSSSAKVLYIYLRNKFNKETLNDLTLTYTEMKDIMSTATMSRALKDLAKADFIEVTKLGGLYGGSCRYKLIGKFRWFYYTVSGRRFRIG